MFGSDEENDLAASIVGLCEVGSGLTMGWEGYVPLCSETQTEERGLTKAESRKGLVSQFRDEAST